MKRHQSLQILSREHHKALRLAVQAKRVSMSGDQLMINATASACLAAFYTELDPHFVVEESSLLPLLAQSGEDKLVQRVQYDHRELRRLCRQLQNPDSATLLEFGELLMRHVRFEERELFVALEAHFGRLNKRE